MKRIILLILAPALSLTAAFSLTSCDALNNGTLTPPADENGDTTPEETPDGGNAEEEKGEDGHTHNYINPVIVQELNVIKYTYTCDVCGETKTTETVIDSVVDDADAWKAAFGDLKFLNFEMKVYFYYDNDKVHTNHCIVTENAVYYHIEDAIEYYSVRGEDGLCTTYARTNSTDKFTKLLDTSDKYITAAQYETVISVSFADHFDKFTYDETTGAYTCTDTITAVANDASGNPMMELSCFNINLLVADGKITKIASQYKIDANDDYSFEYYNIGLMELTVPSDVIENAVPESADNPFGGFGDDSNTEGEPVPAPDGENGANSEAVTPEN